jgi:hypothetical protein
MTPSLPTASFAVIDYKVPYRAFIKQALREGRNPLITNYVGYIGKKPVYDVDGPLEAIDDVLICTERDVCEVTTEEWRKLKGYALRGGHCEIQAVDNFGT